MRDRRLVLISDPRDAEAEEALVILRDYLHVNAPVTCELIGRGGNTDQPSFSSIDSADAVILFARQMSTAGPELERLQSYCRSDRPLISLRPDRQAFANWPEFDEEILGSTHRGHHPPGVETAVRLATQDHDILDEVLPFPAYGALCRSAPLASDAQVLLHGQAGDHDEPLAWIRERGGPRFTTSLGDPGDFWELDFLRLLENAVRWACGIGPVPS